MILKRVATLAIFPWLYLLITTSCGGSSGGGVLPGPGGGSTTIRASFLPAQPAPGSRTVALAEGRSSANLITLRVNLTEVDAVYGASFDLTYDSLMATFVNWSPGSALEQGGHTPNYQLDATKAGRLVVVVTRVGPVLGANLAGTHDLVSLTFRINRLGSSRLAFDAQVLLDDQLEPQPISGVSWYAGTLLGS